MADVTAGVAVSLVLVPQAMAYAELAGLPAGVGLFAAALPPILAAPFASSPYLQTGPTAMTALLTFGVLTAVAEPQTAEYVALAALLAMVVGLGRLAVGVLRLGQISYLMSQPVLTGFTTGAAVLIISSQLPTALGVSTERNGVLDRAGWALAHPGEWQSSAMAFALGTAVVMIGGRRIHRLFPGVLLAVAVGIAISEAFDYGGSVIGTVDAGFPALSLDLQWDSVGSLVVGGLVIAIVGFAEPAALARTFATIEREPWDPNREFVGQGMANLASAVSGGLPVGGSFSRSSLNHLGGARTRWSGAITGIAVLSFLPFAYVVEQLPRAVLAAIVIVAGVNLIEAGAVRRIALRSRPQGSVAAITFVATLATAPHVERAVLIGIAVSIGVHLWRESKVVCSLDSDGAHLIARVEGVLWFGSSSRLENLLGDAVATHPEVEAMVVDLAGVGRLDYSAALIFEQFLDNAEAAGVKVEFRNVAAPARRMLKRQLDGRVAISDGPS